MEKELEMLHIKLIEKSKKGLKVESENTRDVEDPVRKTSGSSEHNIYCELLLTAYS